MYTCSLAASETHSPAQTAEQRYNQPCTGVHPEHWLKGYFHAQLSPDVLLENSRTESRGVLRRGCSTVHLRAEDENFPAYHIVKNMARKHVFLILSGNSRPGHRRDKRKGGAMR